ncbi:MAG TPA: hypothetical protein VI011_02575 [Asanoa sp.]
MCFERAARLGTPTSNSALQELERHVQCGFDASGKGGGPLAEAKINAEEIKVAAG